MKKFLKKQKFSDFLLFLHLKITNNMSYTYEYPRPAVTADCVVITKENEPFKGQWAFPGGFMSHRMAIEHGDRINAAAPVRILDIHGTTDPVVGYDGGSDYFGYQLGLSVENILNYWINANGLMEKILVF